MKGVSYFMVNMNDMIYRNKKDSVIRCIELIGLKNPGNIIELGNSRFSHTNTRGRERIFEVMSTCNQYIAWAKNNIKHKLHKVNSFYIIETDAK